MDLCKQLSHAFVAAVFLVTAMGSAFAGPDNAQERLNKNRRKWVQKSAKSYQFELQRTCFCLVSLTRRVKITVREGVTESIQYAETGDAIDRSKFDLYYTVEGLFDYIQSAIDKKAHFIGVVYNAELGYPTSINIDYIKNAIDDEMNFNVRNLVALTENEKK